MNLLIPINRTKPNFSVDPPEDAQAKAARDGGTEELNHEPEAFNGVLKEVRKETEGTPGETENTIGAQDPGPDTLETEQLEKGKDGGGNESFQNPISTMLLLTPKDVLKVETTKASASTPDPIGIQVSSNAESKTQPSLPIQETTNTPEELAAKSPMDGLLEPSKNPKQGQAAAGADLSGLENSKQSGLNREQPIETAVAPTSSKSFNNHPKSEKSLDPSHQINKQDGNIDPFKSMQGIEHESHESDSEGEKGAKEQSHLKNGDLLKVAASGMASSQEGAPSAASLEDHNLSINAKQAILSQVSKQIKTLQPGSREHIRFQFEPENFGSLQIDLSVHKGLVVAHMVTGEHVVKALLEGHQGLLRQGLSEQGFNVKEFSVDIGEMGRSFQENKDDFQFYNDKNALPKRHGSASHQILPVSRSMGLGLINLYV